MLTFIWSIVSERVMPASTCSLGVITDWNSFFEISNEIILCLHNFDACLVTVNCIVPGSSPTWAWELRGWSTWGCTWGGRWLHHTASHTEARSRESEETGWMMLLLQDNLNPWATESSWFSATTEWLVIHCDFEYYFPGHSCYYLQSSRCCVPESRWLWDKRDKREWEHFTLLRMHCETLRCSHEKSVNLVQVRLVICMNYAPLKNHEIDDECRPKNYFNGTPGLTFWRFQYE